MDERNRLEAFEKMLIYVRENYVRVNQKMSQLKVEGKEKSATYRQLMGNRLQLTQLLAMYKAYGLTGE